MSRILHCEDETDVLEVVKLALVSAGHHIDQAETADLAIELFDASLLPAAEPYDLIISDIEMPSHAGFFFISHVRAKGYTGRIAALTAKSREPIQGLLQRFNVEFWPKPESITRLTELVEDRRSQRVPA